MNDPVKHEYDKSPDVGPRECSFAFLCTLGLKYHSHAEEDTKQGIELAIHEHLSEDSYQLVRCTRVLGEGANRLYREGEEGRILQEDSKQRNATD